MHYVFCHGHYLFLIQETCTWFVVDITFSKYRKHIRSLLRTLPFLQEAHM